MKTNQNAVANKFAAKKAAISAKQVPTIDFESALKPILKQLELMEARNLKIQEMTNKLYELVFNSDNSIALLEKLQSIENKLDTIALHEAETVKPAMQLHEVKTETVKPAAGNVFDTFKENYPNTITDEKQVKNFFTNANFASMDSLKESFASFNRSSEKLLCARRSNAAFLQYAMDSFIKCNAGTKTVKAISEKVTTPVKNFKTWAKELECDESTLVDFADMVEKQNFLGEDDRDLLIEFMDCDNSIERDDKDINKFIVWVCDSLHIKQ